MKVKFYSDSNFQSAIMDLQDEYPDVFNAMEPNTYDLTITVEGGVAENTEAFNRIREAYNGEFVNDD